MNGRAKGYVWGPINPEDLAIIPGTDWVICSSMAGPTVPFGRLHVVNAADLSCSEAFPYALSDALDRNRFGEVTPVDPLTFKPHGVDVIRRDDGVAELFVVNHGGREAVEVFEVLTDGLRPTLRWIGAAELPRFAHGNDVAGLKDGGFLVTNFVDLAGGREQGFARLLAGEETGWVLEWTPRGEWRKIPGSDACGANGVAVSADGEEVYVVGWHSRSVKIIPRHGSGEAAEARVIQTDVLIDNITWTPDGRLLGAGGFDIEGGALIDSFKTPDPTVGLASRVVRIDPKTLTWEMIVEYPPEHYGVATTGHAIGDEIWVGSLRASGIARFSG